ncbi:MAG: hypothetical protein ACD_10C00870G0001, partial [uncultured bacterium]
MNNPLPKKLPSYLLIFFLPVAFVLLLAGGLSLVSFYKLQQDYSAVRALQARDIEQVAEITQFNEDIASIQREVAQTLERAGKGKLDEAGVYQVHSQVVNQLADLGQRLSRLQTDQLDENLRQTGVHFQAYRNFIIQATDIAAIDPPMAMQHAYQAANNYLFLAEHTHAIAKRITGDTVMRGDEQEKVLRQHVIQNAWIVGMVVVLLMLIGFVLLQKLTRRLAMLSGSLDALAKGDIDPASLPAIGDMAGSGSLLRDLAGATLAFHETSVANRQAQIDLGERMKELSCLLDVLQIIQRDDFEIDLILETVAARLAAAMFYPGRVAGRIECGEQVFGLVASGPEISAAFVGVGGKPSRVAVAYRDCPPGETSELFFAEEQTLLDAIATYLAGAIERRAILAVERDRQALFDAVIAGAPDAIELLEAKSLRFVESNEASCRMLGYSGEEKLGLSLPDIQGEGMPAALRAMLDEVGDEHEAKFETLYCRKDGYLIDVWVSVRRVCQSGRDYLVMIWRDITAEKAAAAEIRKLSLVVEQSPSSVVITDTDGRIEYVNDAFASSSGYSREDLLGRNPRFLKSGKTPRATYQAMWESLTSGQTWKGEFINRTRQGKEQIEAAIIVPLRQSNGQITHYVAIKEDVTAKKELDKKLNQLYLAVEQSPESIVITNLDAQIEYVNAAFLRNTGYSREEVFGENPRVLKSGLTPKAIYEDMWATLARGELWCGELVNRRKDGSQYIELANIAPIRQADGAITHYLAIKEDITEKKQMSDELERHREHLEQLVESRTAALNMAINEQNALFDTAASGIVLVREQTVIRCNHRMDEMFGYAHGEMLGQSTRIWYPDDESFVALWAEIYHLVAQGGIDVREMPFVRKDRSRLWVRSSCRAIDKTDLTKGLVVLFEDISVERAAAEALHRSHEEQQAIFDTANSGIALIKERIILRGNRRLHEMFGW